MKLPKFSLPLAAFFATAAFASTASSNAPNTQPADTHFRLTITESPHIPGNVTISASGTDGFPLNQQFQIVVSDKLGQMDPDENSSDGTFTIFQGNKAELARGVDYKPTGVKPTFFTARTVSPQTGSSAPVP